MSHHTPGLETVLSFSLIINKEQVTQQKRKLFYTVLSIGKKLLKWYLAAHFYRFGVL
jgi:hypothetical protein